MRNLDDALHQIIEPLERFGAFYAFVFHSFQFGRVVMLSASQKVTSWADLTLPVAISMQNCSASSVEDLTVRPKDRRTRIADAHATRLFPSGKQLLFDK